MTTTDSKELRNMKPNKPIKKPTETDRHVVKTYWRISRDASLGTFDWLRDLMENNDLDLFDLNDWQHEVLEANERLRKKLISKYGLEEENDPQISN